MRNGKVHKAIRTVPYDPTQSKEGLLIDKNGSTIYDDTWMHLDVLEKDESYGGDNESVKNFVLLSCNLNLLTEDGI